MMRRFAMIAAAIGFGLVGGFCVLEGVSSLVLAAADVLLHPGVTKKESDVRYDSELGWVNRANVFSPNRYGPGIFLHTNAQGFRGEREVPREAPHDRLRIVCSGDSFTFGYGVDDDHTWCHGLGSMDPRLETVNLGVVGYGIDQAYLRYQRSGNSLEHAVHVFAFITQDLYRSKWAKFFGYGKPVLTVQNGALVATNVPVPRAALAVFFAPLTIRIQTAFNRLRAVELVRRARRRLISDPATRGGERFEEAAWPVTAKIFEALQQMSRAAGRTLLVVYLPVGVDYMTSESDPWRERLRAEAENEGFFYLDLVPALRQLPPEQMAALFLAKSPPGAGHYSNTGHEWVARRIHEELERFTPVATRLSRAAG